MLQLLFSMINSVNSRLCYVTVVVLCQINSVNSHLCYVTVIVLYDRECEQPSLLCYSARLCPDSPSTSKRVTKTTAAQQKT